MLCPKEDKSAIKSILVRCPNWLGDAVMALGCLNDIRTLFPEAYITALGRPAIGQLLQGSGVFDSFQATTQGELVLQKPVDLGVLCTGSFSSAWAFWRAGIPRRLGFVGQLRSWLLNMPVDRPTVQEHDVETYRRLLHIFGPCDTQPSLQLKVFTEEQTDVRRIFDLPDTFLVVNMGAAYGSAKCWPREYFREVFQQLSIPVICIGNSSMQKAIEEAVYGLSHVKSLAGKTSIRQVMAVISLSTCVLTNDSGPMHMAYGLNRPVVAIFGSTNPYRTGPYYGGQIVCSHETCSPCYKRVCPIDFRCMKNILPSTVLEKLYHVI